MTTLEEYKEMIVNTFSDDILTTKEVRRERLERDYSDELLTKTINDTYEVANEIFSIPTFIDDGYVYLPLVDMDGLCSISKNISLGVFGGHVSEKIYYGENNRLISPKILKQIFGNHIRLEENEHIFTYITEDDPDIMSEDAYYELFIGNFPENIEEIEKELFEEEYHQITFDEYMKNIKVLTKK